MPGSLPEAVAGKGGLWGYSPSSEEEKGGDFSRLGAF